MKIFYSWQSDLPDSVNRTLIGTCLENVAKSMRVDNSLSVEPVIDRDTADVPGAPDIATAIFFKIDQATVFVGDVSIVAHSGSRGRPSPNPNVLIELGYALKALGQERIVLVANSAYGDTGTLPFDLRGKRVIQFSLREQENSEAERSRLESALREALQVVLQHHLVGRNFARYSDFAADLFSQLVQIRLHGEQIHLGQLRLYRDRADSAFRAAARWLREESVNSSAIELNLESMMGQLSQELEELVHLYSMEDDESDEYSGHLREALALSRALQEKLLQAGPVTPEAQGQIKEQLAKEARKLAVWAKRLKSGAEINSSAEDQMVSALMEIGFQILRMSYFGPFDWLSDSLLKELQVIGNSLHLFGQSVELMEFEGGDDLESEVIYLNERLQRLLLQQA